MAQSTVPVYLTGKVGSIVYTASPAQEHLNAGAAAGLPTVLMKVDDLLQCKGNL